MKKYFSWGIPSFILICLLGIWELGVRLFNLPLWQLPAPLNIGQELVDNYSLLLTHAVVTLQEVIFGFFVALICGIILAICIAYSKILERSIYPIIIASQTIPVIAIAPLLLIWIGYGIIPKIIIAAITSFFPITVNTVDGLRSVDKDMVNMMRTMGASRLQIFTKLQIPNAMSYIFSGIKVGISISVIGAVIGEWVGGSAGLGYLMTYSQPLFLTARVFAAIFILSVMGVSLFLLASLVERVMLSWYFTEKQIRSLGR